MTPGEAAQQGEAVCPVCERPAPAEARFCPSCGSPLAVPRLEERRFLTVAFADVSGFTALSERHDPEVMRAFTDRTMRALARQVRLFGGAVDKLIGDGLLAVFGFPTAHEDDAERAVRCGLAMQRVVGTALFDAFPEEDAPHRDIALRVGVNSGEVIVGRVGEGRSAQVTVIGDVVNTASRLQGAAGPGEVLVGPTTAALSAQAVQYEHRRVILRGKAEAVDAYLALDAAAAPAGRAEAALHGPLVGRERELSLLTTLASALLEGRAAAATILGEPGIGKSRLANELIDRLRLEVPDLRVLGGRCPPYGSTGPFWPLAEAIRGAAGIEPDDNRDAARKKLEDRLLELLGSAEAVDEILPSATSVLRLLDRPPGTPGLEGVGPLRRAEREEVAFGMRRGLSLFGRAGPTVVMLDDMHWADDTLLDLLDDLPRSLKPPDLPVLFVFCARPELLARRADWGAGWPNALVVTLAPLGDRDVRALVEALLGRHLLDDHFLDVVVHKASGNPLFVEELISYLRDNEMIVRGPYGWESVGPLDVTVVPESVRALVAARLDALTPQQRALLQEASILSPVFTFDELALSSAFARPVVVDVVESLLARGFLERPEPDRLGVKHAVVRDVSYTSLPKRERALRHRAIAERLESQAALSGRVEEFVPELAHHWDRVASLGLGLLDAQAEQEAAARAATYLVRVADDAWLRGARAEAERWLKRAAGYEAEIEPFTRAELLRRYAELLLELGHLDEAGAVCGRLEALADELAMPPLQGASLLLGAQLALIQGHLARAHAATAAADDVFAGLGDAVGRLHVLLVDAQIDLRSGASKDSVAKLARAGAVARRLDDRHLEGVALQLEAFAYFHLGRLDEARHTLGLAIAQLQDAATPQDTLRLSWCYGILAFVLYRRGDLTEAQRVAEQLRAGAEASEYGVGEGILLALLSRIAGDNGHYTDAQDLAERAVHRFASASDPWGEVMARTALARSFRLQGRLAEANERLQDARAGARALGDGYLEADILVEDANRLLAAGDLTGARDVALGAAVLARDHLDDAISHMQSLIVLGKTEAALGKPARAERWLRFACERGAASERSSAHRHALAVLAALLVRRGRAAEALAVAEEAVAEGGESVRVAGRVSEARARALWDLGRTDEAVAEIAAGASLLEPTEAYKMTRAMLGTLAEWEAARGRPDASAAAAARLLALADQASS